MQLEGIHHVTAITGDAPGNVETIPRSRSISLCLVSTGSALTAGPIIDRFYFSSIYFREPSGVLFEIATLGPGFTADEDLERLGQALSLPPNYEHLRDKLKEILTPLPDPRERARPRS